MDIKSFGFYFLIFIILVIAFKFYTIISSFFPPIAAAFVLSYLGYPIYSRLLRWVRRTTIAALMVIVVTLTVIIIPATFVLIAIQRQVASFFNTNTITAIHAALLSLRTFFHTHFNIDIFRRVEEADIYAKMVETAQNTITALGPQLILSLTSSILSGFLILFLMYYLLQNADRVLETFRYYFPLTDKNINLLLAELAANTRALILGQLLIAMIQGSLGAIGFLIFGIPNPILWGFVMIVLSFIPFLGSFLIWFPAGVIQLLHGNTFSGIGIILWGGGLVGTIDNIIRPKLTSALGRIHPVTVLLGVFIGLKEWGIIGLVLGPLIISVLIILIRMFREEYLKENRTGIRG
jgi:predicted PurR-regulated permease PerM